MLSAAEQQLSASVMGSIEEPAVVTAQRSPVPPRSDHISFLEGHNLYVWGGCQVSSTVKYYIAKRIFSIHLNLKK